MNFDDFVIEGKIIIGEKDIQKARALIKMSKANMGITTSLKLNDDSASIIFSMLYESFRQIVEAMCLAEGYKVYSHEALTAYLLKKFEEQAAEVFDRYRKLRNGVNYYGKPVSLDVAIGAKNEVRKWTKYLIEKYLKL